MTEKMHNHMGNTPGGYDGNEANLHEDLCAYILGELDGTAAARIEAALADSSDLREERDRIEATIGLVKSACGGGESLSPEMLTTLEAAARTAPRPIPWYSNTPLRLAASIAALTGGILGGKAMMQDPPTTEQLAVARLENEIEFQKHELGLRPKDGYIADFDVQVAQGAVVGDPADATRRGYQEQWLKAFAELDEMNLIQTEAVELDDLRRWREVTQDSRAAGGGGGGKLGDYLRAESEPGAGYGRALEGPLASVEGATVIDPNGSGTGPGIPEYAAPGGGASGGEVKLQAGTVLFAQKDKAGAPGTDGMAAGRPSSSGFYSDSGTDGDIRGRVENHYGRTLDGKKGLPAETPAGELNERSRWKNKESRGVAATEPEATVAAPGPAGPASPGPVPARLAPEDRKRLAGLGYVGGGGGGDGLVDSDDFFLGHGQASGGIELYKNLTPEQFDELCRHRVDRILVDCRRMPNETPSAMFFRYWGDNAFELAQIDNLSTFGVDVDTASYALARRYLSDGHLPQKAQIRTEEFVNYFDPDVAAPTEEVFAIHTDLATSRFGGTEGIGSQRWMMRVVVRGREVSSEERSPLALTFVVDTSGSMKQNNRLELVKHSLRLLTTQLDANDSIAIVAFSREARLVLPMTSIAQRGVIEAAIYGLNADGGTNAESGLRLGYEVATAGLTKGATNRVVFLSDGVANIGQVDQDRLNADVKRNRDLGIYLNTIGVGLGNHNDTFLEQLANKGDGLCNYIDSADEARRALVDNFISAFEPIARDVKIQVEFDKTQVYRYRLLGYENRAIADADFRNDTIDAGEIGAGHQVVALYEIELTGTQSTEPLASVRLRWKDPIGVGRDPLEDTAQETSQPVYFSAGTSWEASSDGNKRSTLVAQFAEILRRSVHARGDSLDELITETAKLASQMGDPDLVEFHAMLRKSRELIIRTTPRHDDLTLCIDAIRRNRILHAQYEAVRRTENRAVIDELERQNQQLEARIRDLIRNEIRGEMK